MSKGCCCPQTHCNFNFKEKVLAPVQQLKLGGVGPSKASTHPHWLHWPKIASGNSIL